LKAAQYNLAENGEQQKRGGGAETKANCHFACQRKREKKSSTFPPKEGEGKKKGKGVIAALPDKGHQASGVVIAS